MSNEQVQYDLETQLYYTVEALNKTGYTIQNEYKCNNEDLYIKHLISDLPRRFGKKKFMPEQIATILGCYDAADYFKTYKKYMSEYEEVMKKPFFSNK